MRPEMDKRPSSGRLSQPRLGLKFDESSTVHQAAATGCLFGVVLGDIQTIMPCGEKVLSSGQIQK